MAKFSERVAYELVKYPGSKDRRTVQVAAYDGEGTLWKFTHHAGVKMIQVCEVDVRLGEYDMNIIPYGTSGDFRIEAGPALLDATTVSCALVRSIAREWITDRDQDRAAGNI